jgi:hypothetical protein
MKKEKLPAGTKVRITGNSNNHGFDIGDIVEVVDDVTESADEPGYNLYYCKNKNYNNYSIRDYDIEVVKEETLLQQAIRMYPVGTKFNAARGDMTNTYVVESELDFRQNPDGAICTRKSGNGTVYFNGKWAEIIREAKQPSYIQSTKTNNMSTKQTVTREQLKTLHSKVCGKWQSRIEETIKSNIFADSYEVSNELLKEAFDEADTSQTAALLKVFIKPGNDYATLATGNFEPKVFENKGIEIGKSAVLEEFRGKSIIFNSSRYEAIIMPNTHTAGELDTMIIFKEK